MDILGFLSNAQSLPPVVSIIAIVVFAIIEVVKIVADKKWRSKSAKSADESKETIRDEISKVNESLESVRQEVRENHEEAMQNQVTSLRYDIICYADQIISMENPTREHFIVFEDLVDRYVKLSEKYKITDGKVIASIRKINEYQKKLFDSYIYTLDTIERFEKILRGI